MKKNSRIDFGSIKLVKKNEVEKQKIIPQIPTLQTEISFKLLKTDKNNNKYYTYPANEELFKKEAFKNGGIIVGIIHHNGYVEYIKRRVKKIWDVSVCWNIDSMPTGYKDLKHLSEANNLIVYACPININLKTNKQWLGEIASKNRGKKWLTNLCGIYDDIIGINRFGCRNQRLFEPLSRHYISYNIHSNIAQRGWVYMSFTLRKFSQMG